MRAAPSWRVTIGCIVSCLQVVQYNAVYRRLMTVPGVGPVATLSFKVGVDDPRRFARSRTVGAHCAWRRGGTSPARRSTTKGKGRISKQGDIAVREAFCEAAASLLLRVRKWSALRAWGLRIAKRSSMLCAITAVSPKLASILHRMWVSETDFHVDFGPQSHAAAAVKACTIAAVQMTTD